MYQQYVNQARASITNLSSDELKELLNDDEKLEERMNEALVSLESEKDEILFENRITAEENLRKEPEIIELRGRINGLSEEGKTLCESVQEKMTQIKEKSGNMSQDTALALLQTAAAESEEESEKLVKNLMDNELPLESFLEQFLSTRKTMHLRKIKSEKMSEIIRNPPKRNSYIGPPPAGPSGFFPTNPIGGSAMPYPVAGSLPYPLGPIPMPMPMPGLPRPF